MWSELRPILVLTLVFTLLTGLAYPLAVTGLGQTFFPRAANGSLIKDGDRIVGSALIGQHFTRADYFHARPSYAGSGYAADNSGGSNLGPTDGDLIRAVAERAYAQSEAAGGALVPIDLVTGSASGLDPHISPEAAYFQAARVAAARHLAPETVESLIRAEIEPRILTIIGMPRVNVLRLNLALDARGQAREVR